jgi:hypothetical protein
MRRLQVSQALATGSSAEPIGVSAGPSSRPHLINLRDHSLGRRHEGNGTNACVSIMFFHTLLAYAGPLGPSFGKQCW